MLDAAKRQELVNKLRNRIKQANSNVSTKVEAQKGRFGIVISESSIDHFYDGKKVASLKVAELDDNVVDFINSDPQDAAQEILGEFMASYSNDELVKEAANAAVDSSTADKITQKQLEDNNVKLHPRTNEFYKNITQKQLPEHDQRPGTYDVVTEAQFRDERTTFYGADRTSGDWKQEDRNIITEGQFEEGVKDFTDVGASDRNEIGSKYDGGLEKQHQQIGEKQLMELLKHHKWEEPLTVTEGKDQLGKQDGELARVSAETASKIIKEALNALGKTVIAVGITPSELSQITARLVSHPSKLPVLANTLGRYAKFDVSAINKKVAKARHFGKTANTGNDWSEFLAADVLVRQLSKLSYDPRYVVEALSALASDSDFASRINKVSDEVLANTETEIKEAESNASIFKKVLSSKNTVEGDDSDGRYAFAGTINEVVEATGVKAENKEEFAKAAASYATKKIAEEVKKELNLVPDILDVNSEKGVFEIQLTEASRKNDDLAKRAERRRQLAKQAEARKTEKTAQMGGAGGMPPAAGPEMGNPAPPPGGGDMGMPPAGEALSQDPAAEGPADDMPGGSEPKPPGSICPSCGSEDVDVDNGEMRCNNCGAEGTVHVRIDLNKWPETIKETEVEEKEGFGLDEPAGLGDEEAGMAEGEGTTLPNAPIAASFRLTHRLLEKLASQNIRIGSVCPSCGSNNTETTKSASHKGDDCICWDCMQEFNVQIKAAKGKKNSLYGQYIWRPMTTEASCKGCNRLHKAFVQSLKDYGMSWNEFTGLKSTAEQVNVILKMASSGSLNLEPAMQQPLPLQKIAASARWKGYEKFDKFPSATCIERVARRYGENATAMSGPCQGKSLADCVCGQLASLGIYSDGLAAKVASVQASKNPTINNPMKTCVAMMVRDNNLDVNEACTVCDALRAAYASSEELAIEAIAQINPMQAKPMKPSPKPMKPMSAPMGAPGGGGMPSPGGAPSPAPMGGSPEAKPMMNSMPKPMDDVITDDAGPDTMDMAEDNATEMGISDSSPELDMSVEVGGNGLGDGLEEGFGDDFDDFAGEDLIGLGDEGITIKLPQEAVDAMKILMDALKGQIGDDMIDTTGDDMLDMGDVTEDHVDNPLSGEGDVGIHGDEEIPGLAEDSEELGETPGEEAPGEEAEEVGEESPVTDNFEKSEENHEEESEDKSMLNKHTENKEEEPKEEAPEKPMLAAAQSNQTVKTASTLEQNLMSMKRGTIKTMSSALDSVFEGLLAQAEAAANKMNKVAAKSDGDVKKLEYKDATEGSKVKVKPAQDATDVKYQDGGKMGAEEAFKTNVKSKPDVPRGDSLLGDEGKEMKVSEDSDLPSVPNGTKLMDGEEHYKPEKGNMVDGNQGKSAQTKGKSMNKTAKIWTVAKDHKFYSTFMKKAEAGEQQIKLNDGVTYDINVDQNDNIVLIAKALPESFKANMEKLKNKSKDCKPCKAMEKEEESDKKAHNSSKIKKESQTVTPNNVKRLEDDPDLNPSSGPGKGKVKNDATHSLAVDEKKPSEGMNEPDVPKAPNGGQLTREHTYTKDIDAPEFPAGGGVNSEYDTVEKYHPEKQEEILGKDNGLAAAAKNEEATKIAGQLLKMNQITVDELPEKVRELSKASVEALADYKKLIATASVTKGMQKEAAKNSTEQIFHVSSSQNPENSDLKSGIQSLFTLDRRNEDHESFSKEKGNHKLWR